jgi:hypothetical protein
VVGLEHPAPQSPLGGGALTVPADAWLPRRCTSTGRSSTPEHGPLGSGRRCATMIVGDAAHRRGPA